MLDPARGFNPDSCLQPAEYIEQAYLFDLLCQRSLEATPMQELLDQLQHELLSTTRLPMAVQFMLTELRHTGMMSPAMQRLSHYFAPFQTFLIAEAESERGRFSMSIALQILHFDAKLRSHHAQSLISEPQDLDMLQHSQCGMFFFQFETLCRNRLGYDAGLTAMSRDAIFNGPWHDWLLNLRANVGLIDLADLLFLASEEYVRRLEQSKTGQSASGPILFGEKEGRIAFANRQKDPLYLFGAMQRHLGYPPVPRLVVDDEDRDTIPKLLRRIERLETRVKIMEQESKESFDLSKFYKQADMPTLPDNDP
ncbi:MAG: hypothetical protein AAF539_07825 [Planctomycetota bacterium]